MRDEEAKNLADASENYRETDHPWVDLPMEDDTLGEAVRYSLDEIRFA